VNGTLIFFNPAKRLGYIRTDDGERLLIREGGFAPGHELGDRCAGTKVEFDRIEPPKDEPQAVNVMVVPLMASRRARRRR
jgi:cold shock CspA family protein